jgi:hypothetical protein
VEVSKVHDCALEALTCIQRILAECLELIEWSELVDNVLVFLLGCQDEGCDAECIAGSSFAIGVLE